MPVSFDSQIPKKGDQRQMEARQRIGTYAAGLALDSAGIKGNKDILSKIDMVVAAGGGERDLNVDTGVLTAEAKGANAPGFLNERLMSDLRPTLFWRSSQPARRQHRHRARARRHLAHLHGRRGRRRRCRPHCACAHRLGRERHRAGRRFAQWRAQGSARPLRIRRFQPQGQIRSCLGAQGPRRLRWDLPAPSRCWSRRRMRKRAAPSRSPD